MYTPTYLVRGPYLLPKFMPKEVSVGRYLLLDCRLIPGTTAYTCHRGTTKQAINHMPRKPPRMFYKFSTNRTEHY